MYQLLASECNSSFPNREQRLYVGSRDCSRLAENLAWQVAAARRAIRSIPEAESVAFGAVLSFVDGEWPGIVHSRLTAECRPKRTGPIVLAGM